MDRGDLQQLSKEELIELVLKLQRPEKTSRTSSKPPSTDRKERRDKSKPGGAKPGHEGHSRVRADAADRFVDHKPVACACCGEQFIVTDASELIGEYDAIDLPEVTPTIERHRRFALNCRHCGRRSKAPLPAAAKGTPFGPRIHALAIYLKTFQAFSYERLQRAFLDLFGLNVSQGALMNMFSRTSPSFQAEADKAVALLRQAKVVASDETGVRIEGSNGQNWVFLCEEAVVHIADPSRSAEVVRTTMGGHKPLVWISDRYSAQQNHGDRQQTCLAHLARDVAFADEHGSDDLPARLKLWFGRAFELAREIKSFAASTIAAKRRHLEKSLDAILATATGCELAQELKAKIARARHQMLTFCDFPGMVEATNNACERALRPAVIQRKVTNGYRAMWAAKAEAAVRTTVATARLGGNHTLPTILDAVS
jgi:transposase